MEIVGGRTGPNPPTRAVVQSTTYQYYLPVLPTSPTYQEEVPKVSEASAAWMQTCPFFLKKIYLFLIFFIFFNLRGAESRQLPSGSKSLHSTPGHAACARWRPGRPHLHTRTRRCLAEVWHYVANLPMNLCFQQGARCQQHTGPVSAS